MISAKKETFCHRMWKATAVRVVGGFHEWWPLCVCIHDDGITVGWRRVIVFDRAFVPPTIIRAKMTIEKPHD